jgi:hypothetical protein
MENINGTWQVIDRFLNELRVVSGGNSNLDGSVSKGSAAKSVSLRDNGPIVVIKQSDD